MVEKNPLFRAGACSIPHHTALVVDVLAMLHELDVLGFLAESNDRTEYSPEVPGLVSLIVGNNISEEAVNAVFDEMFDANPAYRPGPEVLPALVASLETIRGRWLRWGFLERLRE